MIAARGLSKVFRDRRRGEIRAVDRISFSCEPGGIYGLLGANGAGKTTALRLLATLLKPTEGDALVAGCSILQQPREVRARIGFLAASTALYGRLTARETIAYFGRLHGMEDGLIASRTEMLVDELGMREFVDRRVESFSTGMKQKTSIARTLIHDPEVLIFDEPTLGLDVMASRAIIEFVRRCRERGRTIIYSTHMMSDVETLCDRIGIIHGGQLLAEGSLAELQSRHQENRLEEIFIKVAVDRVSA